MITRMQKDAKPRGVTLQCGSTSVIVYNGFLKPLTALPGIQRKSDLEILLTVSPFSEGWLNSSLLHSQCSIEAIWHNYQIYHIFSGSGVAETVCFHSCYTEETYFPT